VPVKLETAAETAYMTQNFSHLNILFIKILQFAQMHNH